MSFLFRTGLFDVIPYVCGEMKPEEEEAFEKIFRKWIALFNNATFPFYWQRFEPEREATDRADFEGGLLVKTAECGY